MTWRKVDDNNHVVLILPSYDGVSWRNFWYWTSNLSTTNIAKTSPIVPPSVTTITDATSNYRAPWYKNNTNSLGRTWQPAQHYHYITATMYSTPSWISIRTVIIDCFLSDKTYLFQLKAYLIQRNFLQLFLKQLLRKKYRKAKSTAPCMCVRTYYF